MRWLQQMTVVFVLAAVSAPGSHASAQTRSTTAMRRAIDAVNDRYIKAFNAGDVSKFAQAYAPDATLMPSNSPPIHGQDAIAKYWQGGWTMGIRNVKLTTTEVYGSGKGAAEVGQYQLDIQPASGPVTHDHGKYIVLWKRSKSGAWQWYRDIFNSDVPAAAPDARH